MNKRIVSEIAYIKREFCAFIGCDWLIPAVTNRNKLSFIIDVICLQFVVTPPFKF